MSLLSRFMRWWQSTNPLNWVATHDAVWQLARETERFTVEEQFFVSVNLVTGETRLSPTNVAERIFDKTTKSYINAPWSW